MQTQPNSALISGTVQSGSAVSNKPLANKPFVLYQTQAGQPQTVDSGVTDDEGRFHSTFAAPAAKDTAPIGGVFYITVMIDTGVCLQVCLGLQPPTTVVVNELTTVAASFALAQFMAGGQVQGDVFGLQIAAGMNDNLVDIQTGEPSPVLLKSPNADQTISLRLTLSLANLLAACVASPSDAPALLLALTPDEAGSLPTNTSQAFANLARMPGQNIAALYANSCVAKRFSPTLVSAPDAWTICVKVNDSGSATVPFGGPATLVFDSRGYGWVTNNVVQGTGVSSSGLVVLKPNGKPADGQGGTPCSPLVGGGLLGAGFGIAVAADDRAWVGNFGWGGFNPQAKAMGSVSHFAADGRPLSPARGYQGGAVRAQAVAVDFQGNVWVASFGNNSVVVFLGGNPDTPVFCQSPSTSPFGMVIAADEGDGSVTAWVTNSGGLSGSDVSSVSRFRLVGGVLTVVSDLPLGKALKAIALDSLGNAWVASGGDDTVYMLNASAQLVASYCAKGIKGPWGLAIDGNDNIWIANFGSLAEGDVYHGAVALLAGANPTSYPQNQAAGSAVSPESGYTLASAGEPVLLPAGEPLYGANQTHCYIPLMRQTNCTIDRAGNLWVMNNWKPAFNADAVNPGGDGIVIFVGVARPQRK